MTKQTLSTRALLACGLVAGPMYVTVTLIQALTREGFDLRYHRFSWLTAGDLGWIHQLNMVLVGALTVLLAIGLRRVMRTGTGAVWGPRLIALTGVAYFVGGLLTADPVVGFPAGTTEAMVQKTWHGGLQNATRGISTMFLISASIAMARWSAAEGRRAWAWFFGAGVPALFAILALFARVAIGGAGVSFLVTPWIWMTVLAAHTYRLQATRSGDAPAGQGIQATS